MATASVEKMEGGKIRSECLSKVGLVCSPWCSICLLSFCFSFDLVTMGAMSVTLMFQRPPFLTQTRTILTPNNNFLVLEQVTMSREEAQPVKCDIRSVLSPYPLVLPYPLPRYAAACAEKGPVVPELQVWNTFASLPVFIMASVEAKIPFVTALQIQPYLVSQKFANFVFHVCIMQIRTKKYADVFFICLLSTSWKQIRWVNIGRGG